MSLRSRVLTHSKARIKEINASAGYGEASVTPFKGGLVFNITCRVQLAEMREWTPERITQFFNGVALVIHAGAKKE